MYISSDSPDKSTHEKIIAIGLSNQKIQGKDTNYTLFWESPKDIFFLILDTAGTSLPSMNTIRKLSNLHNKKLKNKEKSWKRKHKLVADRKIVT